MPVYEYCCEKCQKIFEHFHKSRSEGAPACPTCGGEVEKIISRTSFQLKGSGWYATDYANTQSCGTSSSGCCHSGSCGCSK